MRKIIYVLMISIGVSSFALDTVDDCEKQYALPQPAQKLGRHAMRSQQEMDAKECSSKVGPDFCVSNQKANFMKSCGENVKKEQEKRMEEAALVQEKLKKEKEKK